MNWSDCHERLTQAFKYAKRGMWSYVFALLRRALSESNKQKTMSLSGKIIVTIRKLREKQKKGLIYV